MLRAFQWVLLGGGTLLIGAFALARADAWLYEAREAGRLESRLREGSGPPDPSRLERATRSRALARSGAAWGRVELPRLAVSALVAEGVDATTLRRAVGHLPESAFPGEAGDVALAGHRDTFFRGLAEVREGDAVRLLTPDGSFLYTVVSLSVVDPSDADALRAAPFPTLTLVTCHPFGYVGPAPQRLLVRARQVAAVPLAAARQPPHESSGG